MKPVRELLQGKNEVQDHVTLDLQNHVWRNITIANQICSEVWTTIVWRVNR